ncbi:MAG: Gmad2 immunoglobulin-like domain-containing protein [Anaerolineales bacterium]
MIRAPLTLWLVAALLLAGCDLLPAPQTQPPPSASPTWTLAPSETPFAPAPAETTPTSAPPGPTPAPSHLTPESIRNARYVLGGRGIFETVQLANGAYQGGQGADYVSVSLLDFLALADLDGDAAADAVTLAAENYGGSGLFVYLVVFLDRGGQPQFYASRLVDDRPLVNALTVQDGDILLDVVLHSFEDAACCPSFRVVDRYRLEAAELVMRQRTSFTPGGLERRITIDAPRDGEPVSGSVRITGSVTITPFEANLACRIYDSQGNELAALPFPVSAAEMGAPGTFDHRVDLSAIPAGTTIRLELQDLSMADGSLMAMNSVVLTVR